MPLPFFRFPPPRSPIPPGTLSTCNGSPRTPDRPRSHALSIPPSHSGFSSCTPPRNAAVSRTRCREIFPPSPNSRNSSSPRYSEIPRLSPPNIFPTASPRSCSRNTNPSPPINQNNDHNKPLPSSNRLVRNPSDPFAGKRDIFSYAYFQIYQQITLPAR